MCSSCLSAVFPACMQAQSLFSGAFSNAATCFAVALRKRFRCKAAALESSQSPS